MKTTPKTQLTTTKKRPLKITITDKMADDIDELAEKMGWPQTMVIERSLVASIEALKRYDPHEKDDLDEPFMNNVLDQLARTTLLPEKISAKILSGTMPPIEDIVMPLLLHTIDCEAMTSNDPASSWNERRIARQVLAVAFLGALQI
jgi:hypothetical protein